MNRIVKTFATLVAAAGIASLVAVDTTAKSGGSSFSSSSSSSWGRSSSSSSYSAPRSSTPSSGGYSKPSATPTAAPSSGGYTKPAAAPPSSGGYAKPVAAGAAAGAVAGTAATAAPSSTSNLDRSVATRQSGEALSKMRAEQSRFSVRPSTVSTSNPLADSARGSGAFSPTQYHERRTVYYRDSGWSPPVYVYQSSPTFGAWDALFLWSMLDRDRSFHYHHATDPGYLAWRREADRLSASNAELKAKLASIDADAQNYSGTRNPKYLPKDVTADVALAPNALTGLTLTFATGVPESTYAMVCDGGAGIGGFKANAAAAMEVKCVTTSGSRDNVLGFLSGRYDAVIAQADAIDWVLRTGVGKFRTFGKYQQTAYSETMWLLVNKGSGITAVSDLKPGKHTIHVGPSGSGTEVSFRNLSAHARKTSWLFFSQRSDQYEGVSVKNGPYLTAVEQVASNPNDVMLVMMGGASPFMKKVNDEFGDKVALVPFAGDWSLSRVADRDGNNVYQECTFKAGHLPKLQTGSEIKTLCVQAVVALSSRWTSKYGETAEQLFLATWDQTKNDLALVRSGVK